jgi:hypothetical protein
MYKNSVEFREVISIVRVAMRIEGRRQAHDREYRNLSGIRKLSSNAYSTDDSGQTTSNLNFGF